MTEDQALVNSSSKFTQALDAAARFPGVRINRESYLRAALRRYCSEEQIARAVAETPAVAGVSLDVITKVANTAIKFETTKVTGLSTAAGIPGGLVMAATVPADAAQYFGHVLRIVQKLVYIYSWPDLFDGEEEEIDEAAQSVLTLFVGVMFGVRAAQVGVSKLSTMIAGQVLKNLPQKALTKTTIFPIAKQVAKLVGVQMTKRMFAGGVAKMVPVLGAAVSGGITLATFFPMSKKLQDHLASLDIRKSEPQSEQLHVVVSEPDVESSPT